MHIFIQPSDVLLFRDGRPFSAGEGHRARSLFPPNPTTMQGVIRSKVLAEFCGRYHQYRDGCAQCSEQPDCNVPTEIGKAASTGEADYGQLSLQGPLIAQYQESQLTVYFSVANDVVQLKNENRLVLLQPLSSSLPGESDLSESLKLLWSLENEAVENASGYWSQAELQAYLLEQIPQTLTGSEELFQKETRVGIEVNNSRQAVEEGKIYQTEFIRCQEHIGLYLEVQGISRLSQSDADQGLLSVGGESRSASYYQLPGITWEKFSSQLASKLAQSAGFKIYLATPTIFNQGWLPAWIDAQTLTGSYQGIDVHLEAVALGKYQTCGGWDIAFNRPKPTRRAISAGSVYYFTTSASAESVIDTFHWHNLADNPEDAQIGFGLGLVGCWNYGEL